MMLGMVIMIFMIFSDSSPSFASSSARRVELALTWALTESASSFLPCAISFPISLDSLFRLARRSSASFWVTRFSASNAITSSTSDSLLSWNLFLMFCLTMSGFSLTNFKSNMVFLLGFLDVMPSLPSIKRQAFLYCYKVYNIFQGNKSPFLLIF